MSCTISLHEIGAKRGEKTLFEGVSLHVGHKEKIAIIGPNGAGKTTLLEIMGGLRAPDFGRIELFHNEIKTAADYAKYRSSVGYLFQNSDEQFIAPIVFDDVAFGLRAKGESDAESRTRKILETLEISHLADKIVFHLSGGEKKLVALAGVLVCEPKIILLDEPTTALDYATQKRLAHILGGLDVSEIIVSHDKEFIAGLAEKIYYLTPSGLTLG